jgi:hypothetical protein
MSDPRVGGTEVEFSISERFGSAVTFSENREKKRSKPSSKLRCDSPTIYATRA